MTHPASAARIAADLPAVLVLPAEIASVPAARDALGLALDRHGWETEPAFRVILATGEATANAVKHGSAPGDVVEVAYLVGPRQASVRVLDGGAGAPWTPPDPSARITAPDTTATGGRGLALIAEFAQRFEVRRAGRGTELRLDFLRTA